MGLIRPVIGRRRLMIENSFLRNIWFAGETLECEKDEGLPFVLFVFKHR